MEAQPLGSLVEFGSETIDEVRTFVGANLTEHTLDIKQTHDQLNTNMKMVQLGDVALTRLKYGAPVEIRQIEPEDAFFFSNVVTGGLEVKNGNDQGTLSGSHGAVLHMNRANHIRLTSADMTVEVLRLERAPLEQHIADQLGRGVRDPLTFDFDIRYDEPGGRALCEFVRHSWALAASGVLSAAPLVAADTARMLKSMVLCLQPNNYSDALNGHSSAAAPRYVRRAETFIEAHAAEPLTIAQIVEVAGVSARSLHAGFQRFRSTTPMSFLRDIRLQRAQTELASSDPAETTVTTVALTWGFSHLGRFAASYRQRFGESPSATLRHGS